MKESLARRIKELAALDGVSGFEQKVTARMAEAFEAMGIPTRLDALGNLIATRQGTRGSPTLMVAAHADEIGAVVKSIDPHGFLRFEKLGGTQDLLLLGRMVSVNGVFGVVGARSGHLQKGGVEVPRHTDMYVDVGANSAAEAEALGIRVGDPIASISEVRSFSNPDLLCGKAIDNRVSCAMLLQLFEDLLDVELPGTIHGVVNVQEEIGWRGIQPVARRLNPDAALVVDTIPSGDTPDVDFEREIAIRIGGGPVIPLVTGASVFGYIAPPAMRDLLLGIARAEGIPHQPAVFPGNGSDATTLYLVGEGIPTGVVNIPRRYSHSPVEMLNLNDVVHGQRLLTRAVVALAGGGN